MQGDRLVKRAEVNAEIRRREEMVSLILLCLGSVLGSIAGGLAWGWAGAVGILALAIFIVGYLIGKD